MTCWSQIAPKRIWISYTLKGRKAWVNEVSGILAKGANWFRAWLAEAGSSVRGSEPRGLIRVRIDLDGVMTGATATATRLPSNPGWVTYSQKASTKSPSSPVVARPKPPKTHERPLYLVVSPFLVVFLVSVLYSLPMGALYSIFQLVWPSPSFRYLLDQKCSAWKAIQTRLCGSERVLMESCSRRALGIEQWKSRIYRTEAWSGR